MKNCLVITTIMLVTAFCGFASADQIKLTDGTVIYGKVQDEFNPEVIVVETPSGTIPIYKDKILYIRKEARETVVRRVERVEPANQIGAERWYLGLDVGSSTAIGFCDGLPFGYYCNDTATAVRIGGGYQVSQFFGVEAAYADNGRLNISSFSASGNAKITEVQASAMGTFPFGNGFAAILKGGVTFWNKSSSGSFFTPPPPGESGAGLLLGVGGQYDFTEHIAARFMFEGRNVGEFNSPITGGTVNLSTFYLGLVYKI
ncbi:MAG: outer membrane beta-barrel protein [Nitrospinae bacterium]|nr:outer membrane beta-barrel protein [Nitrospinota bacterium]